MMNGLDDPMSEMSGGYAPSDDTPTHFLGRRETERLHAESRMERRAARGLPVTAKPMTRVVSERVAPGVRVNYEVPAHLAGSDQTPYAGGEKAQTEKAMPDFGSSISDPKTVGGEFGFGDDDFDDEDDVLGQAELPMGPPEDTVPPEMPEALSTHEQAMDGGPQTKVVPPTGIAGYSSRRDLLSVAEVELLCPAYAMAMRRRGLAVASLTEVRQAIRLAEATIAEEREEEKEEQVAPDPDEAFAID